MRRPIINGAARTTSTAGQSLKDELTVIWNALVEARLRLGAHNRLDPLLADAEFAAKRCVLIANGLERFSQRAASADGRFLRAAPTDPDGADEG